MIRYFLRQWYLLRYEMMLARLAAVEQQDEQRQEDIRQMRLEAVRLFKKAYEHELETTWKT